MERYEKPWLEIVYWQDVRDDVIKVNPGFAAVADAVNPGKDYPLIRARYPFGHQILDHGKFTLPFEAENVDSKLYQECKKLLSYVVAMRSGIVLKNSLELYIELPDMILPCKLMHPGRIFALWLVLQPPETSVDTGGLWSVTAGARSLTMLPKISDRTSFKRINKEYNLKLNTPTNSMSQWQLFVELANHPTFPESWDTEILFFTNKWLEENSKIDVNQLMIKNFLYKSAWLDTISLRNQNVFDFVFSMALKTKNLKPDPYLSSIARFLYGLGERQLPSYVIAKNSVVGPLKGIKSVFTDLYNLNYLPTMVHSGLFSKEDPLQPCYYSLSHSIIMDFIPKSKNFASKFSSVLDIKYIMDRALTYTIEDHFGLSNTPVCKTAKLLDFSYYHTDVKEEKNGVFHVSKIVERDSTLMNETKQFPKLPFCDTSSFFRGCVRIGVKANK